MAKIPTRTKAEQETTIRWDEEERLAWLCTTTPAVQRRWARLGIRWQVHSRYPDGAPATWVAKIDFRAVKLRRVDAAGRVVKARPGRSSGVPILVPEPTLERGSDTPSALGQGVGQGVEA
jgi:hypothetical protein